jgi:hypothetical protein
VPELSILFQRAFDNISVVTHFGEYGVFQPPSNYLSFELLWSPQIPHIGYIESTA